jgi:hypothetical protein
MLPVLDIPLKNNDKQVNFSYTGSSFVRSSKATKTALRP